MTDRLSNLKQNYVKSLAEKTAEITNCWLRVQRSSFKPAELRELKVLIHRISGSAGMYGLAEVSNSARRVDRHLANPSVPNDEWSRVLKEYMDNLLTLLSDSAQ